MKQLTLFKAEPKEFGGSLVKAGQRKLIRPLSFNSPLHLVLKSERDNLIDHREVIHEKVAHLSTRFGVLVYSLTVNFDHIHLIIRIPNREAYCRWIRGLTGVLTRLIPGSKWRFLPYTRIMSWGRDFSKSVQYLKKNRQEVEFYFQCLRVIARDGADFIK